MSRTYRDFNPRQLLLLPPDLRDWLPEGHLALFVSDLVDTLDLSAIHAVYERGDGRGAPPMHPAMMVRLLVYAYCTGKVSSRKLEKATWEEVPYRVLTADQHPDHDCIAEFRRRHFKALAGIFDQVLTLAAQMGLVKLGHVAIDGSKFKANASKHKAMSYGRMDETQQRLRREIEELLRQAEQVDNAEDAQFGKHVRGDELPPEIRNRQSRIEKIAEAKKILEQRAKEQAEQAAEQARAKQEARETKEAETGKKVGGRPPQPAPDPEQVKPEPKAQYNFTDPDSRIMVDGASKGFEQCYNAQAAVDAHCQIIVAAALTQQTNDKQQLLAMVEKVNENMGRLPDNVSADAGYFSQEAVTHPSVAGTVLHVPPDRQKHGEPLAKVPDQDAAPAGHGPDAPARHAATQMRQRLASPAGKAIYRMRKAIVEPVFGQIKQARGFRRFSVRGTQWVTAEWLLVCAAHNIMKLFRSGRPLPQLAAA